MLALKGAVAQARRELGASDKMLVVPGQKRAAGENDL